MLIAVIIFCEIAFWVLLGLGLWVRYRWGLRRLSTVLLISVPLLDVVLLAASVIDLRAGSEASLRHGLAVAYIAYSVMFGHRTMKWADQKYAHRFAGGPAPVKPPEGGWRRVWYETLFWVQILAAYAIAWGITGIMIVAVDDPAASQPLVEFTAGLSRVVLIAAIWPISWVVSVARKGDKGGAGDSGDDHRSTGVATSQTRRGGMIE